MTRARTFDYAEARRLRWQGLPYWWIARELGVHETTISRACNASRRAYETRYWHTKRKATS